MVFCITIEVVIWRDPGEIWVEKHGKPQSCLSNRKKKGMGEKKKKNLSKMNGQCTVPKCKNAIVNSGRRQLFFA